MSGIPGLVWDACSLLNLLATRFETQILFTLGCPSYVVTEVRVGEVLCLRPLPVEDAKGNLIQVDTNRLLQPGQLEEVAVSVVETATFVEFAAKMDDGEARSAAVAAHRGFWLATDDRVSLRGAREYIPPIPTITTPEWIKYWAEQASVDRQALAETLRRIEICATYRPRREHQLRAWWDYHRMHN